MRQRGKSWPLPRRGFPDLITKAVAFVVVVVMVVGVGATMGMSTTVHFLDSAVVPCLMMSDLKQRAQTDDDGFCFSHGSLDSWLDG